MHSVQQFCEQSELDLNLKKPGQTLCYIQPKVGIQDIQIESILDFNDQNNSLSQLPKFATLYKSEQSTTKNRINQLLKQSQSIFQQNLQIEPTIYTVRQQNSSQNSLIIIIIWLCYFISSALTTFTSISVLSVIDFIGILLACIISLRKIVTQQNMFQFCHILHGVSLLTTVTLYIYIPNGAEDNFIKSLIIIRSFRLLFPLNMNHSFQDLAHKYFKLLLKLCKVVLPLISIVVLFSLMIGQGASANIGKRCRNQLQLSVTNITAIDQFLCGSRECPQNYACFNPSTFNLQTNPQELIANPYLAFGFFSFNNLYRSFLSIISLATLSQSAQMIRIFSDTFQQYFISTFTILVILFVQFTLIPVQLVMISGVLKDGNYHTPQKKSNSDQISKFPQERNASQKSIEDYSAAPTFGVNSNKDIKDTIKNNSNPSLKEYLQYYYRSIDNEKQSILKSKKVNINIAKTVKIKQQTCQQSKTQEQKQPDYFGNIKLFVFIGFSIIQFILSLLFSFQLLGQQNNRYIGIGLCIIFIVWSFHMLLSLYSRYFQEEPEKSLQILDDKDLIFRIQIIIYLTFFFDYLCRVFQHIYIMEQASPLTHFGSGLLVFRLLYLPIKFDMNIETITTLKKIVKLFVKILESILLYLFFMLIISTILASTTLQFVSSNSFFAEIGKHFTTFINNNWLQFYGTLQVSGTDYSNGLDFAIKVILIFVGEIVMMKLIFAQAIVCGCFQIYKNDIETPQFEPMQSASDEQKLVQIKSQKSFFLFQFNQHSLRDTMYTVLQNQNYQGIKEIMIKAYIAISFFGYIMAGQSEIYKYVLVTIDFFILFDAIITIIALRFWGKYSFVNGEWYKCVNFLISFILIINTFNSIVDGLFLRVFRILLLMNINQKLSQSYELLKSMIRVVTRFLPFLIILWLFFYIQCFSSLLQNTDKGYIYSGFISLYYGLQMFQKGFDLASAIHIKNDPFKLFSSQNSLLYLLISISFSCVCIAMMLRNFQNKKDQQQLIQIQQIINDTPNKLQFKQGVQELQKNQIMKHILEMKPEINPICVLPDSYFRKLVRQCSLYQIVKKIIYVVSGMLLLCVGLLNGLANDSLIYQIKIVRLFFFLLQIMIFIVECIAFQFELKNCKLLMFIYLITIPGSFIMLVPFHQLSGSQSLKQLLFLFVCAVPLTLINPFVIFRTNISNVVSYIYNKLNKTTSFLIWIFTFAWFFSSLLHLMLRKSFILTFTYVTIGLFGGSYQNVINFQELSTGSVVGVCIINSIVILASFILKNALVALFIFQINNKLIQKMLDCSFSFKKPKHFSLKKVHQLFQQTKFLQTWNKFDLEASGVLPYSKVFHYLPYFFHSIQAFDINLRFIIHQKTHAYDLKLALLKRLNFPIRTVNILNENERCTQYMITIYDLAARLISLALQENSLKEFLEEDKTIVTTTKDIVNWAQTLGFDSDRWLQCVNKEILKLNRSRQEQGSISTKYSLQKKIDMKSSALGSIIKIFPKLRRKIVQAKEKKKR